MQVYDQNKAAADATKAQLAAAEAQARQVANQAQYAELQADADGVIMEVPADAGQVVSAGQTVVKLARDGPREAEVDLPEGARAPSPPQRPRPFTLILMPVTPRPCGSFQPSQTRRPAPIARAMCCPVTARPRRSEQP